MLKIPALLYVIDYTQANNTDTFRRTKVGLFYELWAGYRNVHVIVCSTKPLKHFKRYTMIWIQSSQPKHVKFRAFVVLSLPWNQTLPIIYDLVHKNVA